MSQYPLRLPDSLMDEAKAAAKSDNTSLNQFLVMAISEKVAELKIKRFFEERIQRADPEAFKRILDQVPSGPLMHPDDRL